MKIPLRFQITEFDCGTVSLQNAISYLFERESIPAELVRAISLYTLDCYDKDGKLGQGGTSVEAINLMTHWFTNYSKKNDFGIKCEHLIKEEVDIEKIRKCINKKGCVLVRSYLEEEHYIIVTDMDEYNVYIWDPYYLDEKYYDSEKYVEIIFTEPFKYNRKVSLNRFNSLTKKDFSLGPIEKRECVLFNRK